MDNYRCGREVLEGLRKDDGELEPKQCLSTREDDTCLGQHLLDLGVKGCARPFVCVAACHCALQLAGMFLSHLGESIPESEGQGGDETSSRSGCHRTEDPPGYDEKIKSQR